MAVTQRATRVRHMIRSMGLLPTAFVVWRTIREWRPSVIARNAHARRRAPGDLPVPPGSLLFAINATRNVEWFLQTGKQSAECFRTALAGINRPIESFHDALDFGCGCGRVLRQWVNTTAPRFHGTDYNPELVRWDQQSLPFDVRLNGLEPPLPYSDATFDLCYAISVFTHLPERLQEPWLAELHRVIKPDGILIVTLSGEGDLVRATPAEQKTFYEGRLLVLDAEYAGTNLCGVYHPEAYVRKTWSRYFEVMRFTPQGATGTPYQDLYVLQRSPSLV
jgi:SAM-dependent methyltransferase